MIEIVKYNDDDLKDSEIDQVVTRVRAFIISSKNDMIVGHDENGYQLIETYVGENESLETALANAIYQECGIALDAKDHIEPFYEIRYYNRNYKESHINRLSDLIYFLVNTDKLPNYKKLKLSPKEMIEKLPLEQIRRSAFAKTLKDYIEEEDNQLNKVKAKELLIAFEKMKEIYKF